MFSKKGFVHAVRVIWMEDVNEEDSVLLYSRHKGSTFYSHGSSFSIRAKARQFTQALISHDYVHLPTTFLSAQWLISQGDKCIQFSHLIPLQMVGESSSEAPFGIFGAIVQITDKFCWEILFILSNSVHFLSCYDCLFQSVLHFFLFVVSAVIFRKFVWQWRGLMMRWNSRGQIFKNLLTHMFCLLC